MGVQLRVEIVRGVVPEGGGDDLLVADPRHLPGRGVHHPRLGGVLLDPGEARRHRAVMDLDDTLVAADQCRDGDRLGRGEGEVPARTVHDLAVLAALPELGPRSVGHLALEDRPEGVRVDRALQPELFRPLAGPGTRLPVLGIVLRVIAVLLEIARALRGRRERPDREHVRATRTRGRCRHRRSGGELPVPNRHPAHRSAAPARVKEWLLQECAGGNPSNG